MSNERLLEMNAPPEEKSWLKSGLASLPAASRAASSRRNRFGVSMCGRPGQCATAGDGQAAEYSLHHGR